MLGLAAGAAARAPASPTDRQARARERRRNRTISGNAYNGRAASARVQPLARVVMPTPQRGRSPRQERRLTSRAAFMRFAAIDPLVGTAEGAHPRLDLPHQLKRGAALSRPRPPAHRTVHADFRQGNVESGERIHRQANLPATLAHFAASARAHFAGIPARASAEARARDLSSRPRRAHLGQSAGGGPPPATIVGAVRPILPSR